MEFSYAQNRPGRVRSHIQEKFNISGTHEVTLNVPQPEHGKIKINSLTITDYPWTGTYFNNIPISFTAIPSTGYKLNRWLGANTSDSITITLSSQSNVTLTAIFGPDFEDYGSIVINEINYNSANNFDPEDWVELYNYSDAAIDISGWHFQDNDETHDFVLPPNTILPADGFLVLCRDTSAFFQVFPDVESALGDFGFGLSGTGEWIGLFNEDGNFVDSLEYDDQIPWPTAANGGGPTLELIDSALDNTRPESWQASLNNGSPGEPNSPVQEPFLKVNPDSLYFFATIGSATLDAQAITITETTGGPLQWTAQENPDQTWMRLINTDGGSGDQISVIVDVTGLEEGTYTGSVRIADTAAINNPVEVYVQLDVTPRPNTIQITTTSLDTGTVGIFYSDTLQAIGGILPYHWQVIENILPFGLSLDETTGAIQGTPENAEHFYFRIKVTDTHVNPSEDIKVFSILIQRTNYVDYQMDGTIDRTMLFQNTPNPFNSSTAIRFQICEPGNVTINIYDIMGQKVCTLLDEDRPMGHYTIFWNGRDGNGQLQTSGVYF